MRRTALTKRVHALWQSKGVVSTLLLPLAWMTATVVAVRKRRIRGSAPHPVPTIVVGNLVVGGTGKTPVVIAVVQHLQARGWTPGVISRGYGVEVGAEPRTGQGDLSATSYGDEPALIARMTAAPLAVHPRRAQAREALLGAYPQVDVVISDDGLQHLALSRQVEIVVQDERGVGNGRLLPAGPLREPASKLADVDFVVNNITAFSMPNSHKAKGSAGAARAPTERPETVSMRLQPGDIEHLQTGRHMPWNTWVDDHRARSVAAVAAIGQPQRFFSTLEQAGLSLSHTRGLPDHDTFQHSPFLDLTEDVILVTAKDAVKCARFEDPRVWIVHVQAHFSDPAWLDRLVSMLAVRSPPTPPEGG